MQGDPKMKALRGFNSAALIALAILSGIGVVHADNGPELSDCAWPILLSPEGLGNWLGGPDNQARYWMMAFPGKYQTMEIKGHYPQARYFSVVAYNAGDDFLPTSTAGHLFDAMIEPDQGGFNPFQQATPTRSDNDGDNAYTIFVTREDTNGNGNTIHVTGNYAWIMLRIYVPNTEQSPSGQASTGGVPLPIVKLYGAGTAPETLQPCPIEAPSSQDSYPVRSINKLVDVRAVQQLFFPDNLILNQASDQDEPAEGRLWFAPPWNPPMILMPNPDNKYLVAIPGPYQEGRVIVLRARAPRVPGAYDGRSKSRQHSGNVDLRYWSMCNTQFEPPIAAVGCFSDRSVVTQGGWFTVAITDDLTRPEWLPRNINWLPWGDAQYPKWFFYRNMIPVESDAEYDDPDLFPYAIQKVLVDCWKGKADTPPTNQCRHPEAVVDFTFPDLPPRADIDAAGPYVQEIMGDYYPVAAWCDKSTFLRGGWRACLDD